MRVLCFATREDIVILQGLEVIWKRGAMRADRITSNPVKFPGFRDAIENALDNGVTPCGVVTGLGTFTNGVNRESAVERKETDCSKNGGRLHPRSLAKNP